ncbi:MAG: hypothetical protein HOV80_09160 [Polyangiaceae bacterium]|nr:hypothetical protein [Polyangiaceae bacterium]
MSRARSLSMFLAMCSLGFAAACGGAKSPEPTPPAEAASQDATEAAPTESEAAPAETPPDAASVDAAGEAPEGTQ